MKPGTIIKLPDGRIGTIVYHGLTGYGFIWGKHEVPIDKILETCPLWEKSIPIDLLQYQPQAMLRKPEMSELLKIDCVGENYEIVEVSGHDTEVEDEEEKKT